MSKSFHWLGEKITFHMLKSFSFVESRIHQVMPLITTSFLSIIVSDSPLDTFYPYRDIKQGDPISPYLFPIMVEGLRCALNFFYLGGALKGFPTIVIESPYTHQKIDNC